MIKHYQFWKYFHKVDNSLFGSVQEDLGGEAAGVSHLRKRDSTQNPLPT